MQTSRVVTSRATFSIDTFVSLSKKPNAIWFGIFVRFAFDASTICENVNLGKLKPMNTFFKWLICSHKDVITFNIWCMDQRINGKTTFCQRDNSSGRRRSLSGLTTFSAFIMIPKWIKIWKTLRSLSFLSIF